MSREEEVEEEEVEEGGFPSGGGIRFLNSARELCLPTTSPGRHVHLRVGPAHERVKSETESLPLKTNASVALSVALLRALLRGGRRKRVVGVLSPSTPS